MQLILKIVLLTCTILNVFAVEKCVSDMQRMKNIMVRYLGHSENSFRYPAATCEKGERGFRGPGGAAGAKGDTGECVCDLSELGRIKERLTEVEAFNHHMKDWHPEICYAGITSGRIKLSQISASSTVSIPGCYLSNIKLDGILGWCADALDNKQWVQVDLQTEQTITGVVTQGRSDYDQWVTEYQVSYGNDVNNLAKYEENGTVKTFSANKDGETIVSNRFSTPITARYFRLHLVGYHNRSSMKMDLLVC